MTGLSRALLWSALGALATSRAAAQGLVISGASSAQLIDVRPLVVDSLPFAATDSAFGVFRRAPEGFLVQCSTGDTWCRFLRSAAPASLVALIQDVDVAAWGLATGVSAHAQLRARTAAGSARELWPQARQTFDVLAAYVDIDRELGLARLGRQWVASGLGMFNFDGASLSLRPWPWLVAGAYGGGSLVEGMNRPLSAQLLAPVEDLPPSDRAYLLGARLTYRPDPRASVSAQYQRAIRRDRGALYSERVAADGELRLGETTVSALVTRDLATGTFNDLSVQLRRLWPGGVDGRLRIAHSAPYFDLWTIWGAFSPVGYDEAGMELLWGPASGRLSLSADAAARRYAETGTGVQSLLLRTEGWRVGGTGTLQATAAWSLQGSYHFDIGFGASRSDGDLSVGWQSGDRISLRAHGVALEQIYEFRLGTGRVVGGGVESTLRIAQDLRIAADVLVFRNSGEDRQQLANWNQRRASIRLEWTLGSEPGFRGMPADVRGSGR